MEELQIIFAYINQFLPLAESDFLFLASHLVKKSYEKKDIIIKAGEVADSLYFITKGTLREYFVKDKHQVTTDIITEGTISGSVSSFFSNRPSVYNLEAMETVQLYSISKSNLEKLYTSDVKWERFGRILTSHFLLKQEQHILDGLRYTVRERFSHFFENNLNLLQRAQQKHLASYLNIKPETFSRLKKALHQSHKKQKNSCHP